jgi:hypothetical protein
MPNIAVMTMTILQLYARYFGFLKFKKNVETSYLKLVNISSFKYFIKM